MPTTFNFQLSISFVRLTGLEPARRETLDPKSSASTNSATGANGLQRYDKKRKRPNYSVRSFLAASIMVSIPFAVSSSFNCTL